MSEEKQQFKQEYDEFMSFYLANPIGSEEIGKKIGRQIQFYGDAVKTFVNAKILFDRRLSEYEQKVDENTGKVYSSTKAEKIVNSLPEGAALLRADYDLKVILEQVRALRDIQGGIEAEMKMSGGM